MKHDSDLPDLSGLRGMSDPFFFAFDVIEPGRILLCHAVIFSSFVVPGDESKLKLCALDSDPRMRHFQRYVAKNYGAVTVERLESEVEKLVKEIDKSARTLIEIKREIKKEKDKHEH